MVRNKFFVFSLELSANITKTFYNLHVDKHEVMEDLPGFSLPGNKTHKENAIKPKKSSKSKKSGGFQSMGLSFDLLKGITRRGYKVPTPIQRKTIPLILEGRDVVAMAKTGSGKTACFLIPMFEKLKRRDPTKGARALILSPTRELAIQTFKFIKELGKFVNLKSILVLGGDSLDSQFSAIHSCPDIIVATPGRFLHLCVEMDLKLNSIEYVVCDEADRLFEMGFGIQLNETLNRLPANKQMVMFSATLPKLLVEFAKAGLSDPVLIRLDVETKLPEGLALKFVYCRPNERYSTLVSLLKNVIPSDAQTVVFAGTQHHVELISFVLTQAGISNTCIYSSLDPTARKINTAKFTLKKVSVLVVTDVAARGIDIPSLDYVVNLHFPGKPKLFVHRVGRCARAGRQGTAFSIFSTDDQAHLLDLHLFLNRPFNLDDNKSMGIVPQDILEEEHQAVEEYLKSHHIASIYKTSENAYKKYISSRPVASTDSNKRVKTIKFYTIKHLEDFVDLTLNKENEERNAKSKKNKSKKDQQKLEAEERRLLEEKHELIIKMKSYRPSGTIFELNPHQKSVPLLVMKEKRAAHSEVIEKFRSQMEDIDKEEKQKRSIEREKEEKGLPEPCDTDIQETFGQVITSKKRENTDSLYKKKAKKRKTSMKDTENYIPYQSADKHTEDGLAINSFEREAQSAEFSLYEQSKTGEFKHRPGMKKWDRIRKKMVSVEDPRQGKIKTESGTWIPSSYKKGLYGEWKEKTKIEERLQSRDNDDDVSRPLSHAKRYPVSRFARYNAKVETKRRIGRDSELKNPEQIVKKRIRSEHIKKREQENRVKKAINRKKHMQRVKKKHKK